METVNIVALVLGFMSVVITVFLSLNTNKLIKTEDARAKEIISKIDDGIQKGNERTEQLLARIDENHRYSKEKTEQLLVRMDETQRHIDETQRYIVSLIKTDGEKSRELIRQVIHE